MALPREFTPPTFRLPNGIGTGSGRIYEQPTPAPDSPELSLQRIEFVLKQHQFQLQQMSEALVKAVEILDKINANLIKIEDRCEVPL